MSKMDGVTHGFPTSGKLKRIGLTLVSVVLATGLASCSDNDDDDTAPSVDIVPGDGTIPSVDVIPNDDNTSSEDVVPGDMESIPLARVAINNGYYLRSVESYGFDGLLNSTQEFEIDYDANTLTVGDSTGLNFERVYSYNSDGDLTLIEYFSDVFGDGETPLIRTTLTRNEGRLIEVFEDNLIEGGDYDVVTRYSYNDNGTLSASEAEFSPIGEINDTTYSYDDNGQLLGLVQTDFEIPGLVVTSNFERDQLGRLSTQTLNYDPEGPGRETRVVSKYDEAGNISEISNYGDDGALLSREVRSYVLSTEPVFNLTEYSYYYW